MRSAARSVREQDEVEREGAQTQGAMGSRHRWETRQASAVAPGRLHSTRARKCRWSHATDAFSRQRGGLGPPRRDHVAESFGTRLERGPVFVDFGGFFGPFEGRNSTATPGIAL